MAHRMIGDRKPLSRVVEQELLRFPKLGKPDLRLESVDRSKEPVRLRSACLPERLSSSGDEHFERSGFRQRLHFLLAERGPPLEIPEALERAHGARRFDGLAGAFAKTPHETEPETERAIRTRCSTRN